MRVVGIVETRQAFSGRNMAVRDPQGKRGYLVKGSAVRATTCVCAQRAVIPCELSDGTPVRPTARSCGVLHDVTT